jgi:hypothetical protein
VIRAASLAVAALVLTAVPAAADNSHDDVAINGTFTVFSDGRWAKRDDSRHDEAVVTQTWTITSTCTTFQDCTGQVTSDQGWTAELTYVSGQWIVRRTVPDWEPCIDGTAHPGTQVFRFWPAWPPQPGVYKGWDRTMGPSGACGFNKVLDIEMPLTLTKIG